MTNRVIRYFANTMETARMAGKTKSRESMGRTVNAVTQLQKLIDEWKIDQTLTVLYKRSKCSQTTVKNYLAGDIPNPPNPKFRSLCNVLGVDADALAKGVIERLKTKPLPPVEEMVDALLESTKGDTVMDLISTMYRDEFLRSVDRQPSS